MHKKFKLINKIIYNIINSISSVPFVSTYILFKKLFN